jgi:hypothetical protein
MDQEDFKHDTLKKAHEAIVKTSFYIRTKRGNLFSGV